MFYLAVCTAQIKARLCFNLLGNFIASFHSPSLQCLGSFILGIWGEGQSGGGSIGSNSLRE